MELQQMKTKEIEQLLQHTTSDDMPALLELLLLDQRRSVQTMAQRYQRKMERQMQEKQRLAAMWQYEQQAKQQGYQWIAGTDEVGRGPVSRSCCCSSGDFAGICRTAGNQRFQKIDSAAKGRAGCINPTAGGVLGHC